MPQKKERISPTPKPAKSSGALLDRFVYYVFGLFQKIGENHLLLLAGGLTFSVFVCIVPLVLVIFAVLGQVFESQSIARQVDHFLTTILPYQEFAGPVREFVFSRIAEVVLHKNAAGLFGGIGVFVAASGLFSSMRTALNTIFQTESKKTIWKEKLRDFGMVALVLVALIVLVVAFPALAYISELADTSELLSRLQLNAVNPVVINVMPWGIIFLLSILLYWLVPYEKLNFKVLSISALWATLFWIIAQSLFGYYVSHFATLRNIYGTYLFIVASSFWLYYASTVFLLGAQIGQLYRERITLKNENDYNSE